MKKYILSLLIVASIVSSCDTDINRDPDLLPLENTALSTQLPAGIIGIVGPQGAGMAVFGGFWSQYWTQSNVATQFADIDGYTVTSGDYQYIWDSMYDGLGDIRAVKRKAQAEGNWKYYLIATVLDVQASQILTDMYGDIPYKEASNPSILKPKFDTTENVYTYMIEDLDDALAKNLDESTGETPGKDDLIFNGNMENWIKFANTLKLKIYIRQTFVKPSIVNEITALMTSGVPFLDVDASMTQFINEINQSNPLYEYIVRSLNVTTNLRMSYTMSSYFAENTDPRRDKYYGPGNALFQGDFSNTTASNIAVVTLNASTPALLLSKEESLFLQAEANERMGSSAMAQTLYEQAVLANFTRHGLDGSSFITGAYAYPSAGGLEEKIKAIITQKWAASFPGNGFEAFFETNRTGYPNYSEFKQNEAGYIPGDLAYSINGSTGGSFPKRIQYPLSERNANPNVPTVKPITAPVWWAKN